MNNSRLNTISVFLFLLFPLQDDRLHDTVDPLEGSDTQHYDGEYPVVIDEAEKRELLDLLREYLTDQTALVLDLWIRVCVAGKGEH